MAHIRQKLTFGIVRLNRVFACDIQFDILDFNRFKRFPQVTGGLLDFFGNVGTVVVHLRTNIHQKLFNDRKILVLEIA